MLVDELVLASMEVRGHLTASICRAVRARWSSAIACIVGLWEKLHGEYQPDRIIGIEEFDE
jgi:hypothetical protein